MSRYVIIEQGGVDNIVISDFAMAENWICIEGLTPEPTYGWKYSFETQTFTAPPEPIPPAPIADPCEWLIDIGPFFDRFGTQKIPVLADTDAIVRAIVTDCTSRKWIDLKRVDVGLAIDTIINKGHAVNKAAILETPVILAENLALRKLYFK